MYVVALGRRAQAALLTLILKYELRRAGLSAVVKLNPGIPERKNSEANFCDTSIRRGGAARLRCGCYFQKRET